MRQDHVLQSSAPEETDDVLSAGVPAPASSNSSSSSPLYDSREAVAPGTFSDLTAASAPSVRSSRMCSYEQRTISAVECQVSGYLTVMEGDLLRVLYEEGENWVYAERLTCGSRGWLDATALPHGDAVGTPDTLV